MRALTLFAALGVIGTSFSAGTAAPADAGNDDAKITRIWLTHRGPDPSRIVVNWETDEPGDSEVTFSADHLAPQTVRSDERVTLHHVEIPLGNQAGYRYRVRTAARRSDEAPIKRPAGGVLRAAVVADWHAKTKLDGLMADDIHLLLTAGDNIPSLHGRCGPGVLDCTQPYGELVDAYPELFRSTPFMPALGNHDREIRPRGPQPPAEPVYDVEATAFKKFFELPGDEWKWHFDLPEFGLRFVALDLNHIQDVGTTWQTCHAYDAKSEQFLWYEKLMTDEPAGLKKRPFVVTLHNERSGTMRGQAKSAWHGLFRRGTLAVTGFGYFAERAEVDGFSYYNTALGAGAKYPDPKSQFFASTASYLLLTVDREKLRAELKNLAGEVLDRKDFSPAAGEE